jgi:hypothetical protein
LSLQEKSEVLSMRSRRRRREGCLHCDALCRRAEIEIQRDRFAIAICDVTSICDSIATIGSEGCGEAE